MHSVFDHVIRSLRESHLTWPNRLEAKKLALRKVTSSNGKTYWLYLCAKCGNHKPANEVEVDHIEPHGGCQSFDDLNAWIRRFFAPVEAYQVLCKKCHKEKTRGDRDKLKVAKEKKEVPEI